MADSHHSQVPYLQTDMLAITFPSPSNRQSLCVRACDHSAHRQSHGAHSQQRLPRVTLYLLVSALSC